VSNQFNKTFVDWCDGSGNVWIHFHGLFKILFNFSKLRPASR
jgi:hypothetical protein